MFPQLQPTSPTLKQLLLWEKAQNIHTRLPRLADKSGSSGLLWIFRQLKYQTHVFENITQVPCVFASAKMAVLAAYEVTYSDYHGFLVKKIFQNSFDAAPDANSILAHMSLPSGDSSCDCHEETATEATSDDDDHNSIEDSVDVDESMIHLLVLRMTPQNPFEHLAQHIKQEWTKLDRFMSQCKGYHLDPDPSRNVLDTPSLNFIENSSALAKRASVKTSASIQTAEEEIHSFISVADPFLNGLEKMILEFNMNDPSKC